MPTRYTVTVVSPGTSSQPHPVLAVPFEPSALVSAFITDLWKRIQKLAVPLAPDTHIATLHLDSENGAIVDSEDILEDVVDAEKDRLFATFKSRNLEPAAAPTVSTQGQSIAVRVITPALAKKDKSEIEPISLPPTATIKDLHLKVAEHLGLPGALDTPGVEHECNCTLAKQLADGSSAPSRVTAVHGKSVVQRLEIPESTTEAVLHNVLKQALGEDVATNKKTTFYGAEHHMSVFNIQGGERTYKKPPVVAICSKQRHVSPHARVQYDEEADLRRILDLHTSELPISRASLDETLVDAGIESEAGVINIYTVHRGIAGSNIGSYPGGHTYRYRAHWEPEVKQSDRGLAVFLSTLYVATKHIQEMEERDQDAFYHMFDLLTRFPPALRAIHILIEGKTPTAMECAALSHAVYEVIDFIPAEITGERGHSRRFEGTRLLFGFLLEQARAVRLPESVGAENLPYLSSFRVIDVRDHKTTEPVVKAINTQNGLVEKVLFENLSEGGILSDSHLQTFLVETDIDPVVKRTALLAGGTSNEIVSFSQDYLRGHYTYADGGDADAIFENSELRQLHQLADMAGRNKLGAHKPSQLISAVAPCLVALDRKGHLAVYTGQLACSGPGESTEIFRSTHGTETINESTLEQIIEPIIAGYEADGSAVFDVHGGAEVKRASKPDEIIMFAVDCSRSMKDPADFDELQALEEAFDGPVPEPTAESVVDPEFYARSAFDDLKDELSKHESFEDMTAIVAEAAPGRARSAAKNVIGLLRLQMGREIMKKHASLEARRGLGYAVRTTELRSSLDKLMAFWAGSKTHEEALSDFMVYRANAAHGVGSSWMWTPGEAVPSGARYTLPSLPETITNVPHELKCPVSHALMEDAVKATDGFTYSRQGIAQWFAVRLSSPMHGLPLQDSSLEANEEVSTAVAQWILGEDMARSGQHTITLTFSSRIGQFERKVSSSMSVNDLYQLVFRGLKARYIVFELAHGSETVRPSYMSLSFAGFRNGDEVMVRLADDDAMAVSATGTSSASINDEQALIKVYHGDRVLCSYWMPRNTTKTVGSILWKFWRAHFNKRHYLPQDEQVVWTDLTYAGDGHGLGTPCEDPNQQLSRFLNSIHCFGKLTDEKVYRDEDDEAANGAESDQPLVLKVKINKRRREHGEDTSRLSRLDVLKQMFDALINRLIAYQFKAHVGLLTFDSNCRVVMRPSSTLENFRRATNDMKAKGDTKLWDGLALAKDQLLEYAEKFPDARKRIIVLSDGADTNSTVAGHDIAWAMFQSGIVVDTISLGSEPEMALKTVSHVLGCYRFHPMSLANALAVCELEPFLSITHRPTITATRGLPRNRPQFINHFSYARWLTSPTVVTADEYPEGKQHPNLQDEVVELTAASTGPVSSSSSDARRSNKRIPRLMNEMKRIAAGGSHPKYDIYVSTSDISFWRIVMQGPDESPYSAGVFMLYMSAGEDYPYQPPEVRFVSKIMHPNISAHGRVCHSLLTGRDWTSDTSMTTVLDTVFGLLLQAETSDPVNVMTTLGFHHDEVEFADEVRAHVQRHANKTRQQWKEELIGDAEDDDE